MLRYLSWGSDCELCSASMVVFRYCGNCYSPDLSETAPTWGTNPKCWTYHLWNFPIPSKLFIISR